MCNFSFSSEENILTPEQEDNILRVARGLNPLVKGDKNASKEDNYDFIQDETMKILTDYIADPKIAKANMKF
jgi:carboxyl-terminal processing protease